MHIDPDTLDADVPNLLLQPLVENADAPRHLAAQPSGLDRRRVAARQTIGLTLRVRDSGYGVRARAAAGAQ